MSGILQRLWSAFSEWREDRRDVFALRRFLSSTTPPRHPKVLPSTNLLLLGLTRFADSDERSCKLTFTPNHVESSSSVFPDKLPTDIPLRWLRLISSAARTFYDFGGVRQYDLLIPIGGLQKSIYLRMARPQGTPFMEISKVPFGDKVIERLEVLIQFLVDRKFDELENICSLPCPIDLIRGAVDDYPEHLTTIPDEGWNLADVCRVADDPASYVVEIPLWTLEEGESDLYLSVIVREEQGAINIKLESIRVL